MNFAIGYCMFWVKYCKEKFMAVGDWLHLYKMYRNCTAFSWYGLFLNLICSRNRRRVWLCGKFVLAFGRILRWPRSRCIRIGSYPSSLSSPPIVLLHLLAIIYLNHRMWPFGALPVMAIWHWLLDSSPPGHRIAGWVVPAVGWVGYWPICQRWGTAQSFQLSLEVNPIEVYPINAKYWCSLPSLPLNAASVGNTRYRIQRGPGKGV